MSSNQQDQVPPIVLDETVINLLDQNDLSQLQLTIDNSSIENVSPEQQINPSRVDILKLKGINVKRKDNENDYLGQKFRDQWENNYQALLRYCDDNGHCNVPQKYKCTMPDGSLFSLGKWVYKQRSDYKKGMMFSERRQRIQELVDSGKFDWDPSSDDHKKWDLRFDCLVEFARQHKHCSLPKETEFVLADKSKCNLYNWLNNELVSKRKQKMRPDRENRFQRDLIDPGYLQWNKKQEADDIKWEYKYQCLLAYAGANNGRYNVPEGYKFVDVQGNRIKLGAWLSYQRMEKRRNKLRSDREAKLQALVELGFVWDQYGTRHVVCNWDRKYDALLIYEKEYGTCNVPNSFKIYSVDGRTIKLGRWLAKQRRAKKLNKLPSEREAKLQKLVDENRLVWELSSSEYSQQNWDEKFNILRAYGNIHGTCELPRNSIIITTNEYGQTKESRLGDWLLFQKLAHKRGTLKKERYEKLQGLVNEGKLSWDIDVIINHPHIYFPTENGMEGATEETQRDATGTINHSDSHGLDGETSHSAQSIEENLQNTNRYQNTEARDLNVNQSYMQSITNEIIFPTPTDLSAGSDRNELSYTTGTNSCNASINIQPSGNEVYSSIVCKLDDSSNNQFVVNIYDDNDSEDDDDDDDDDVDNNDNSSDEIDNEAILNNTTSSIPTGLSPHSRFHPLAVEEGHALQIVYGASAAVVSPIVNPIGDYINTQSIHPSVSQSFSGDVLLQDCNRLDIDNSDMVDENIDLSVAFKTNVTKKSNKRQRIN